MQERRKVPRYPFGQTGVLVPAGGGTGANVTIPVISVLGCGIEGAKGPKLGKKSELYFDWRHASVGAVVETVWKDSVGRMGLRFVSLDPESQKRLNDLCATLRAGPLTPAEPEVAPLAAEPTAPKPPVRIPGPAAAAPRPINPAERREVPRYLYDGPGRVSSSGPGDGASVNIRSISLRGCRVQGDTVPAPGEKCTFSLEWEGKEFSTDAQVTWKKPNGEAGLRFAPLEPKNQEILVRLCSNLRIDRPERLPVPQE